ncbi:MAG: hypothetical protein WCA35_21510 [Kovacikia sp.]
MNDGRDIETEQLKPKLQAISDTILQLAEGCQGDTLSLLALLRTLESLHQEIRDSLFQESLPDNRQALYNLLKDIELSGGWPYIYRMKLQQLLTNLGPSLDGDLAAIVLKSSNTRNSEKKVDS